MSDDVILDFAPGIHQPFCIGIRHADGGFDRLIECKSETSMTRMMARMLPSRDIGLRRRVDRRLLLLPDHHLYVNLRLGACGRPKSER